MPSIRASAIGLLRQLSLTSSQLQSRRIDVSHSHNQSQNTARAYISYQLNYGRSRPPMHSFHTTQFAWRAHDTSTIDYAYMPQFQLAETSHPEVLRIPLLPDNSSPLRNDEDHGEAVESVIRPEISTVSADSTHIDSPSAMSEVTDNHSMELDPYDLTSKVTAAAAKVAQVPEENPTEPGWVKEIWNGFLDDLFGSGKHAKA
ncbi:hypothetical protein MMC07_009190 [Pseudocyphellaria aurata]|nr:hypothetical protein [Pseudocyphellaria aurata]